MNIHIILMIGIGLVACESEKDRLIAKFEQINHVVITGQFEQIIPELDGESTEFLNSITDTINFEPARMVTVGEKYGVSLFCIQFLHEFGNYIRITGQREDFFKYLATQGTPWLSLDERFNLVEEKVRLGEQNYVPIAKRSNGSNVIYWLKFTKDEEGAFKFNLVDFVQQEENRRWKMYSAVLGLKGKGPELMEQLSIVWDHLGDPVELSRLFDDQEFDRSALYRENR